MRARYFPRQTMQAALSITIPFFALILLGTWLRRRLFLDALTTNAFSRFAFYVVMPPLVYLTIARQPVADILNPGFVVRYEIATVLLFLLAYPLGKLLKLDLKQSGILGLNSSYSNYGYIGVPLSILAFGDEAALPLALILFSDTVVLLTMTVFYVVLGDDKDSAWQNLKKIPMTLVKNPLLLAAVLGMLTSAVSLQLPAPLLLLLEMLAAAAAPVALVALGATLSIGVMSDSKADLGAISLMKLIIHPLLVAGLFLLWPGQDPVWIQTAILCACLPVAANVFVLSEHYGAYQKVSANAIMASTLLATLTVPVVLYFLLNLPGAS